MTIMFRIPQEHMQRVSYQGLYEPIGRTLVFKTKTLKVLQPDGETRHLRAKQEGKIRLKLTQVGDYVLRMHRRDETYHCLTVEAFRQFLEEHTFS